MKIKLITLIVFIIISLTFIIGCGQTVSSPKQISLRFAVTGDSRDSPVNSTILNKINSELLASDPRPTFVLFTGDSVNSGGTSELNTWKDVMKSLTIEGIAVYPTIGNHELSGGAGYQVLQQEYVDAFELPQNGPSGYEELVYSFNHENVHIICLDAYYYDGATLQVNLIDSTQESWLINDLNLNSDKINIVFTHPPAYPTSSHIGSSLDQHPAERDTLWDIFDNYNVSLFFAGHEHNYSRWTIDSTMNASFESTIYQVVAGGAGAPLAGGPAGGKNPDVFVSAYNYVLVDICNNQIQVNAYDDDGNNIDSFSFTIN